MRHIFFVVFCQLLMDTISVIISTSLSPADYLVYHFVAEFLKWLVGYIILRVVSILAPCRIIVLCIASSLGSCSLLYVMWSTCHQVWFPYLNIIVDVFILLWRNSIFQIWWWFKCFDFVGMNFIFVFIDLFIFIRFRHLDSILNTIDNNLKLYILTKTYITTIKILNWSPI